MIRVLAITVLAAGCSYTPVADLRVSTDAAMYQRDVSECKQLVDQSLAWFQYDHNGMRLNKCLRGRGHSIIGG